MPFANFMHAHGFVANTHDLLTHRVTLALGFSQCGLTAFSGKV